MIDQIAAAGPALPNARAQSAALNSDFDTFLRMLTVQIQNQDPLNPMQSTDFAVQLATFSGVEQQVRTNEQLGQLARTMGLANMAQLSGWIGMEARVEAPVLVNGAPVTLAPQPHPLADEALLIVLSENGQEVARLPVPVGGGPIDWPGTTASGAPLPTGFYQLRLESLAYGESLGQVPVAHYATVRETRADGAGGVALVLDSGVEVPATSATALRRPEGV